MVILFLHGKRLSREILTGHGIGLPGDMAVCLVKQIDYRSVRCVSEDPWKSVGVFLLSSFFFLKNFLFFKKKEIWKKEKYWIKNRKKKVRYKELKILFILKKKEFFGIWLKKDWKKRKYTCGFFWKKKWKRAKWERFFFFSSFF